LFWERLKKRHKNQERPGQKGSGGEGHTDARTSRACPVHLEKDRRDQTKKNCRKNGDKAQDTIKNGPRYGEDPQKRAMVGKEKRGEASEKECQAYQDASEDDFQGKRKRKFKTENNKVFTEVGKGRGSDREKKKKKMERWRGRPPRGNGPESMSGKHSSTYPVSQNRKGEEKKRANKFLEK